jgi:hypothetical protein
VTAYQQYIAFGKMVSLKQYQDEIEKAHFISERESKAKDMETSYREHKRLFKQ